MRRDVKLPSPRIHLALFRDPDAYRFSYNNTQAVGGGETARQELVSTGWGDYNRGIITTAALHHLDTTTEPRDQRADQGHIGGAPISPAVADIVFSVQNKKRRRDETDNSSGP